MRRFTSPRRHEPDINDLRIKCNELGISCRDSKGEFLSRANLLKIIEEENRLKLIGPPHITLFDVIVNPDIINTLSSEDFALCIEQCNKLLLVASQTWIPIVHVTDKWFTEQCNILIENGGSDFLEFQDERRITRKRKIHIKASVVFNALSLLSNRTIIEDEGRTIIRENTGGMEQDLMITAYNSLPFIQKQQLVSRLNQYQNSVCPVDFRSGYTPHAMQQQEKYLRCQEDQKQKRLDELRKSLS